MSSARPVIPYRIATEADLVLRARDGESGAFDELVRRYRAGVVLIAERILRCPALAEDVAQQALVQAHRALAMLKDPGKFGPWLHAIARRSALRASQGARRVESTDVVEIERRMAANGQAKNPADEVADRASRASVRRLVAGLPPELGEPIVLHYWERWPLDRIAAFLAVPKSTVKWRMYQGRKRLLPLLMDEMSEMNEMKEMEDQDDERRAQATR